MPTYKSLSLNLSALALCAASPAVADVTATELWAEWQAQGLAMGQALAAEEVVESDTGLTLVGFTTTIVDVDVSVVGRIDEIAMTNNDDGTVTIVPSDLYAFTVTFVEDPGDPPINLGIDVTSQGLLMTAGGEVGARSYVYTADSILVEDGEISGGDGNPPTIEAAFLISDLVADYIIDDTNPDDIAYASNASISGFTGTLDVRPPEGDEGRLKMSMSVGATEATGDGSLGNFMQVASNPELVPSGFDLGGSYSYDRFSVELDFEEGNDTFDMFYSNEGGEIAVAFSDTEMNYSLSAQGAQLRVTGSELPIPIDASVRSAALAVQVPLAPGEGVSDIASLISYEDIVIGPEIWGMIDPTGSIPRDPMTMVIDITGTVQLFASLLEMDPTDMGAPPGELRSLSLNELRIAAGGAELTGSGSATFAPGQEVPMPVGSLDLQLSGGMALITAIEGTGMTRPQEMAMVRGMMGAFARPGALPDTLETTIEFLDNGVIIANGVPLQ